MANKSALPLLLGAGAIAVAASASGKKSKKSKSGSGSTTRWGVRISADCQKVTYVDQALFHTFVLGAYEELKEIDPSLELLQITDALFGDIARKCSSFPEKPESSAVAELYMIIAREVGFIMINDPDKGVESHINLIDSATQIGLRDWYQQWSNYPSPDLPDSTPPNHIGVSSDFSDFSIGDLWFDDTLVPFVAERKGMGAEEIFNDFVNTHAVEVGKATMLISDLPAETGAMPELLGLIVKSIPYAMDEVAEQG